MSLDAYYTPEAAAKKLVAKLAFSPKLVGDFCAGGGELLRACESIFTGVKCIAVDKSKRAVKNLRAIHKDWDVFCADFLSDKNMLRTGLATNVFDLVVLNPPFTCRGKRYKIELDDQLFTGSKALLFLVRALMYVRKGGILRAILPSGTICSERDASLVLYLKRVYRFRTYWSSSQISFNGKTPCVVFVDMRKPVEEKSTVKIKAVEKFAVPAYLSRGCLNVIDAEKVRGNVRQDNMLRYVHTTDLRCGKVCDSGCFVPRGGHRVVFGPGVFLPRVGTPSRDKICIISPGCSYVLSDCVIAVLCKSLSSSRRLRQLILNHWGEYLEMYAGTGAQYTTLKRLSSFLDRVGRCELCGRNRFAVENIEDAAEHGD